MIKIFLFILLMCFGFSMVGQYTVKRIYFDTDYATNDTLLLKDNTDSLFRLIAGEYVFAGKLKSKSMIISSEIVGWDTKQDALGFTPLAPNGNGSALTGLTKTQVGLANADNTSDAAKPVSTATQTALNLKANLASPTFTGTVSGVTAAMVGLGNVNNTSDASKPVSTATQTALDGKQATLVSGTNIKTINGSTVLGSGDLVVGGGAVTATAGVGASPTSSSTQTITHNLGRTPNTIRIYGYGTFTSNAAATATTSSMGVFNSSGNFCVYQRFGAAITTTQAGLSSNAFAILLATGGGNFISGVIQNVTSTQFDIVWTETGTATAQVYLWEAQ